MGKPKKQTSPRRTGNRRSHLILKLARKVNTKSPVKVVTTKNDTGKAALQKQFSILTFEAGENGK